MRPYVDAGVTWIIIGPIAATDPANAPVLAEVRERLNA